MYYDEISTLYEHGPTLWIMRNFRNNYVLLVLCWHGTFKIHRYQKSLLRRKRVRKKKRKGVNWYITTANWKSGSGPNMGYIVHGAFGEMRQKRCIMMRRDDYSMK